MQYIPSFEKILPLSSQLSKIYDMCELTDTLAWANAAQFDSFRFLLFKAFLCVLKVVVKSVSGFNLLFYHWSGRFEAKKNKKLSNTFLICLISGLLTYININPLKIISFFPSFLTFLLPA